MLKKDFVPVIQFTGAASVIVTHRQSAFLTLQELVSKARAQPGVRPRVHDGRSGTVSAP